MTFLSCDDGWSLLYVSLQLWWKFWTIFLPPMQQCREDSFELPGNRQPLLLTPTDGEENGYFVKISSLTFKVRCCWLLKKILHYGINREWWYVSSLAWPGGCCVVVSNSRHLSLLRVSCFSPLLQALSISMWWTLHLPLIHLVFSLKLTIFE